MRLPQKVTFQRPKTDCPTSPNAAPATKSNTELLLHWSRPWLNCCLTEVILDRRFLDWTSTWQNCYWTELVLVRTVTLLSCLHVTLLNCYFTELFACYFTERLLDWTRTWLNWTVTWLNCFFTEIFACYFIELLLDWTSAWLNCYLAELLL